MSATGYEEVEHTADLALRVWGNDFFSLLDHAAKGLYHLAGITSTESIPVEWTLRLKNGSKECVLVDFLNELLFLIEENGIILDQFQINSSYENLEIKAAGYRCDRIDRSIKAVTFHNLEVRATESGLETTITFDI
jgi:SHS2 domain-containing protein